MKVVRFSNPSDCDFNSDDNKQCKMDIGAGQFDGTDDANVSASDDDNDKDYKNNKKVDREIVANNLSDEEITANTLNFLHSFNWKICTMATYKSDL